MPRYLVAVMDTLSNGIPGTAEVVLEERVPIYSLHDQSQIRGSFFLGSGNLRGELCYALYQDAGNGGIKLQTVPADRATLFEDEPETPYLSILTEALISNRTGEVLWTSQNRNSPTYAIHVPPGTVIQEYVLDGT
jgi:hypothetical protein